MTYDKQKVIDIALSEVDYLEKETWAQLDDKTANAGDENYTKYSRDLAKLDFYNGSKKGAAWCDVFVDWCFVQAFGKDAALAITYQPKNNEVNYGAGCKYSREYYKNKGKLFDTPQTGDQIFFYSKDKSQIQHTGLVYKVDSSKVYTVEGNTSGASGVISNGGGVCKKSYSLKYELLAGFGRPDYGSTFDDFVKETTNIDFSTEYTTYTVKKGDNLWRIAQKILGNGNQYKEIQKMNGLQSDHISVGQVLRIAKKTEAEAYETYTVKVGDYLWKIAREQLGAGKRYGEIREANGLKDDTIHPGQKLKIPKG